MNRLFIILLIYLISFQQVGSAKALGGIVKFPQSNNTIVSLEVADTDAEKIQGLMGRDNLPEKRGMVFVFRPQKKVTFWMKDTLISLDMIFINNGKIVKITKNAIPNRVDVFYPSGFEVTEVIEVNGGFADKFMIESGDTVIFENISVIDYSKKPALMVVGK